MGSVGPLYQCPWCGRTGNGGYAHDFVGYPICTQGPHACLWRFVNDDFGLDELRHHALAAIFLPLFRTAADGAAETRKRAAVDVILAEVAAYIGPMG
jgi:hypothetical protein